MIPSGTLLGLFGGFPLIRNNPEIVTPDESDVFSILRAFILSLIDTEVIKGQSNRVPMPNGDFICLTPLNKTRLRTTIQNYQALSTDLKIGSVFLDQGIRFDIQVDCYGANSSQWADIITTTFRSHWGVAAIAALSSVVTPLYTSDPRQFPMIAGEDQYEERYGFTLSMQYEAIVTLPQQFSTSLDIDVLDVEATYGA
jgi:hypothetical protein